VERHELQHQIDGALFPVASIVQATSLDSDSVDELNRELSAYLSEFDTAGVSPKLALIHVFPFAFRPRHDPLHHMGQLAIAALSEEDPVRADRSEAAVARRFEELSSLSDDELRQRGRRAYEALFDAKIPSVTVSR
jgi:hypothetical protein